jgi:NADP-dependent 3-hydroxy acid dehydrogenase YdfG
MITAPHTRLEGDDGVAKTIAIVGVGPGIGMAVARKFGGEGFNVALLARNEESLTGYVEELKGAGIEAAAFKADVTDRPGLEKALAKAKGTFGSIDVLEYSPTPPGDRIATPSATTVENAQFQFDVNVLGAIAAVQAVLPDMRANKDGALLFTTAGSATEPIPMTANFAISGSGVRSYARTLNQELKGEGIYAGMVEIGGVVDKEDGEPPAMPLPPECVVKASDAAATFWDMYTKRDRVDVMLGDMDVIHKLLAQMTGG